VTANLVSQQLGVNRKFLHPIPLLTPIVIESRGKPVTVTAIDANHCPGAVMLLFQVGTRNVLHVGDFRWNRRIMQKCSQLNPFFSGQSSLDCIYLDTTYCDEKYALPTQDEAIREAIVVASREVDLACRSKQSLLMLFGAYTIGKERIYMYVLKQA
jgi:DNA cross-link repair 1A protein